jgi:pimeloyl-ACP methyl ester carboxylesterase
MNVLLVPGFWLGAWSWSPIAAILADAGHTAHSLTLPGLESVSTDRAGIRLADHVAAVVAAIDEMEGDVALVGHSGGGPISYAASDQRPDRVSRIIYVDSGPLGDGLAINPNIPELDGDLPLPAWDFFEPDELVGLTPELLDDFRANAIPEPSAVASDVQTLSEDPRRFDIASTIISSTLTPEQLQNYADAGVPFLAELQRLTDLSVVWLPTGHWPQFSRPEDLAEAIVAALAH